MIINETTKSLEEKVYLLLEESILTGEYRRGDSLTEMSLSKKLGVSRTPIRSALHRLYEEGLIEISPNRGAVVVGVNGDDLADAYKIRMRLEGLASSMAAERMDEESLKKLGETVELAEFYLGKGDVDKLKQLDTDFHVIIYKASGNRMLCKILTELHRNIRSYRRMSLGVPGRLERSIEEHKSILEAIRSGDADLADKLTSLHIENAMNNIIIASKREDM
ncbi:MAG: GntR family transcriptional regulator [Clostridia bacterium]|nr:GntR family transcriptional regulator [Clostridia bacterium]